MPVNRGFESVTKAKLTDKQEFFCREYLVDLNATQAAIRAGYSEKTAQAISTENLSKPLIQQRIQALKNERSESIKTDSEYVLRRLREIDELDIIDIMLDDMTGFRPLSEWPKSWRISLSGIDIQTIVVADGSEEPMEKLVRKIKWPDKTKNLELIGRHVGVKAWDKEEQTTNVTNNIMPVPVADSVEGWEEAAQKNQEALLKHE